MTFCAVRCCAETQAVTYKKAGYQFKYIYVTERGKQGACHHHLIIEDISEPGLNTTKMVQKYWKYGSKAFIPLYEDGEFENLAEYIVKKETKEEQDGCTYSRSRNLVVPAGTGTAKYIGLSKGQRILG